MGESEKLGQEERLGHCWQRPQQNLLRDELCVCARMRVYACVYAWVAVGLVVVVRIPKNSKTTAMPLDYHGAWYWVEGVCAGLSGQAEVEVLSGLSAGEAQGSVGELGLELRGKEELWN